MLGKVTLGDEYVWTRHPEIQGIATARIEYLRDLPQVQLEFVREGQLKTQWVCEEELKAVTASAPN